MKANYKGSSNLNTFNDMNTNIVPNKLEELSNGLFNIEPIKILFMQQQRILEQQEFIMNNIKVPECIDIKYIAYKLDLSTSSIYASPWLMPNFGVSDYTTGKKRWKWSTWCKWTERSETVRRDEWIGLPLKTKKKIQNTNDNR